MNRYLAETVKLAVWIFVVITVILVGGVVIFLLKKGLPAMSARLFFGESDPLRAILLEQQVFDGIFPAIAGTFLVVFLSMLWAIPQGIVTGIYLAEFAGSGARKVMNFSFDLLASIPSIVVGLFGLTVAILLHRYLSDRVYPCLLIASMSLAVLVMPYMVRSTQLAVENVDVPTRLAGVSLGASRMENLVRVLLPEALPGIFSGVILSVGRAAEDTAVIMLTGAVAQAGIPGSLLAKFEALPFYIYYISAQYTDQSELTKGFGAAIILLVLCSVLFSFSHLAKNLLTKKIRGF